MLTLDSFLDLLQTYNTTIWPLQIVTNILGLIAVIFVFVPFWRANQVILSILSFLWLWVGLVFCLEYWTAISKPAYLFGVLFVVQGILFLPVLSQRKLSFRFFPGGYSLVGLVLITYALLGYPLVGSSLGHIFPRSLPFGVVPCPTTIFTIGMLLLTNKPFPMYLAVIPLIWSICAVVPVMNGLLEDIGLIIAGVCGIAFMMHNSGGEESAASTAADNRQHGGWPPQVKPGAGSHTE